MCVNVLLAMKEITVRLVSCTENSFDFMSQEWHSSFEELCDFFRGFGVWGIPFLCVIPIQDFYIKIVCISTYFQFVWGVF